MRVTQYLLNQATKVPVNLKYCSLAPRSCWETLRSAANGAASIFRAKTARDKFVKLCDESIIDPTVLGEAELGKARILALYQDLQEIGEQYGEAFPLKTFLVGIAPAMQEFHKISSEVVEKSYRNLKEQCLREAWEKEGRRGDISVDEDQERTMKVETETDTILGITMLNWEKTAIRDEASVEGRLQRMVSAKYFKEANNQIVQSLPIHRSHFDRLEYQRIHSETSKVALLSAKTFDIFEQDETAAIEPIMDPHMDLEAKKVATIAQMEVVYMTTCTFRKPEGLDLNPSNYDTTGLGVKEEEITFDYRWVSVLEGALPNIDDDEAIEWKVTQNRIANEFPNGQIM